MEVGVYINFNGNCREAVEFYTQGFEAEKQQIMTYGDAPPSPGFNLPEEAKNLIMNTQLNIKGHTLMFSDAPPGMPFVAGNNISLIILSKDLEEIQSLYNKLKEGGTIGMELQETFWSKCYGYVIDKFGIGWQLNYCVCPA